MNKLVGILLCLLLSINSFGQVTVVDSFQYGGVFRSYRIFLPTSFTPSISLPLVFNFHGYGSNAIQQELYSGFDAVADTGNFLVCYPNGLNNSWNIIGGIPDDVGYVDTLISVFKSLYNINTNRVYSTGMSNGGFFSNMLGCLMADKIAAIAPVAGTNIFAMNNSCNPSRLVPVLYIHGTADGVVDYNGNATHVSADALMQLWTTLNDCDGIIDTVPVPDISQTDLCTAEKITWADCDSNKRVIHYRIVDGGHTWPGAPPIIGVTNQDFNASGTIWNFFNQYSLATGIDKIVSKKLEVYPNPFEKEFSIELPSHAFYEYEIYSNDGRIVMSGSAQGNNITVDGGKLPPGYYLVRIKNDASFLVTPVIKMKN